MKEIYIKGEMPKSCWECPCFRYACKQPCGLDDEDKGYFLDEIDGGECPLKSLAEHDKQIRKKVVEEIRDLAGDYWTIPLGKFVNVCGEEISACLTGDDFDEILDQIEGGENGKIDNK